MDQWAFFQKGWEITLRRSKKWTSKAEQYEKVVLQFHYLELKHLYYELGRHGRSTFEQSQIEQSQIEQSRIEQIVVRSI